MIDLVALGKVGGIAGVSLGIFLVVYRDVLRKKIFAKLPTKESYQLLRLIIVLTWTIAVLGLAAWLYGTYVHNEKRVATDWRVSGILDELEIGLNRDFVLNIAGPPSESMGKDYAKLEFHVDYYESCCGELTLFYEGGALTAYAIKMTDPPDFAFEIVHPTEGPHYLGKTTFRGLSEHPHIIKDEYIGGKMSMCYLEYYGASSSTRESELFYSTAYSASWFDRDKYKDPRDMPVFSALVVNSSLFCSAEDTKGLDTPSSENCLDPWEIACTYFDNYKSRWH